MPSSSHHPRLPTSPPAPHRRAPNSPTYSPRRSRPRHIRMHPPERNGLFTLCEADESDSESVFSFNLPSATASSDILPLELDVPCDVDEEEMMSNGGHRLSRSSTNEGDLATPNLEEEDPFSLEYTWQDMPAEGRCELPVHASRYPCRPPPLELRYHHPFSAAALTEALTPRLKTTRQPSLLPALPIIPPTSPTTPRSRPSDDVNLVSALEDIISSCGERYPGEVTALSFPLPPARSPELRTPTTPSPRPRTLYPPPPPCQAKKEDSWPLSRGDHSFLNSLSRGGSDSPASSSGSNGSRRSLPERKGLPVGWMGFGAEAL